MKRPLKIISSLMLAAMLALHLAVYPVLAAQDNTVPLSVGGSGDALPSEEPEIPPDPGAPLYTVYRISEKTLTSRVCNQTIVLKDRPEEPLLPEEVIVQLTDWSEATVSGVRWSADVPFDAGVAGDYSFTPDLSATGYAFASDADIVSITVHIIAPPETDDSTSSEDADNSGSNRPDTVDPPESSSAGGTDDDNILAPENNAPDIPAREPAVEASDRAAVPPDTVKVTVYQRDFYEGTLNPPWPEVWVDGVRFYPETDRALVCQYAPTIGESSYDESSLSLAPPGRYFVTVTYETNSKKGSGSGYFNILPRESVTPPGNATIDINGYVGADSRRVLRDRIERLPGYANVTSSRINFMGITATDAAGNPVDSLNGQTVRLRYPSGTSRRTHDFVLVHEYAPGRVESISISEDYNGISFRLYDLSPFALAWRYTAYDDGRYDEDDRYDRDEERYSAFKEGEYDFWMDVKRKIERANDGDWVKVRARGYDKMPETVMRALRDNKGVSLEISWNGGKDIIIPAGDAQTPDGLRIFWPLKRLADLYDGSAAKPDKEDPPASSQAPTPPADPAPGTGVPAAPGNTTGGTGGKPYPNTGGVWVAQAPQTPASMSPANTPDRQGLAETVERAGEVLKNPSILLAASAPGQHQNRQALPDGMILALVSLTVLALFGLFVGVWLFTKKPKS